MADKKEPEKGAKPKKEPAKVVDLDAWVKRKLTAIHKMKNEAKARAVAARVIKTRRNK